MRWLRIGAAVVILIVAVVWLGGGFGTRVQVTTNTLAPAQGALPSSPAISTSAPALSAAPSSAIPVPSAVPVVSAPAQMTAVATPAQAQLAPSPVALPSLPPPQYQTLVTPLIRTLFIALANTPETLTWAPIASGTSYQCQWSTDQVSWSELPLATVGADGVIRCSFTPTLTALYRAYLPASGQYTETVRGVVTQKPGWSGYVVGSGPYTFVTGTFTVPGLLPSASRTDLAEWVGIGGYYGTDPLIQAGVWETYDPSAAQPFSCNAWWEVLPTGAAQFVDLPVAPDDTVTVRIGQEPNGQWVILLTNDVSGESYPPIQTSYSGPGTSAEWIVEVPVSATNGGQLAFGHYTSDVAFTRLGFTGSDTITTALRIVTVPGGVPLSVPSDLSADGRSFTLAYGSTIPSTP